MRHAFMKEVKYDQLSEKQNSDQINRPLGIVLEETGMETALLVDSTHVEKFYTGREHTISSKNVKFLKPLK